jgi:hypothetical protein
VLQAAVVCGVNTVGLSGDFEQMFNAAKQYSVEAQITLPQLHCVLLALEPSRL